jgi:hypothetical protein
MALGYVIAAYGIVIGSLVAYTLWIHNERRKLRARASEIRVIQEGSDFGSIREGPDSESR